MIRAAVLCLLTGLVGGPAAAETVLEPNGYRGEPYNAPVPRTLAGARVIDGTEAVALHAEGVAFVDVYPRSEKPAGLPEGTIWREPRHETIPGAVWLWNTGYDRLSPAEETRLSDGLAAVTQGDPAAPVVIFCRTDCWMSWNAARRAMDMGYSNVIWFPDGLEGWDEAFGDALVRAEPVQP